jgi:hypothetical protein
MWKHCLKTKFQIRSLNINHAVEMRSKPKEGARWLLLELFLSHHWLIFGPIMLCSTDQAKDMLQNKFDLIWTSLP